MACRPSRRREDDERHEGRRGIRLYRPRTPGGVRHGAPDRGYQHPERRPGPAIRRQQSDRLPVPDQDTSSLVETVAEAVLTETVAGMPIDEVLTRGRVAVQERVKKQTQEILDRRRSGIQIISASIMAMSLDRSVAQAFQDVADAMADREKMINEARAYQNNLIPKARGDARTRLSEAEAYKQQRIAEAVGGASRFLALQKEYEKARDVTRTRLYLEAMEKILPKVQLYVIDSDKGRVPLHLRMTGP